MRGMRRAGSLLLCLLCATAWVQRGVALESTGFVPAVIDGGNADRVHLRERPSVEAASLGLYFTGTEALCGPGPSSEWTQAVIGSQTGYIKSEYLRWGDGVQAVRSRQPSGVVRTDSWVNVRGAPYLDAQAEGRLYDGDSVTVLGETASHWYYCRAYGQLGYVDAAYVSLSQSGGAGGNGGLSGPRILPNGAAALYSFSSGAGAWSTELLLNEDGTFSGRYHDTDMGDADDAWYPNGTVHYCRFTGRFALAKQTVSYCYPLTLVELDTQNGEEHIEDGVRYIPDQAYGLHSGTDFLLYTPDAPIDALPEEFLSWPGWRSGDNQTTLNRYGIFNCATGDGFFAE